jgi:hypothetical protein
MVGPQSEPKVSTSRQIACSYAVHEIPLYSVYKGSDVGLDTEKFAYVTLSIFWRRAVHDWTNSDGTLMPRWSLGVFGDQLRGFLSGDDFDTLIWPHSIL